MTTEQISVRVENKASRINQYGRDFLVVPITMIVPGVLNGSKGPLYYPPEEVSRYPDLWNFKPILIGHQDTRDPDVMNKSYVGFLHNTRYAEKLISDGWFDSVRTSILSPTLHHNLVKGIPFEVSTGLSVDVDVVQNTVEYKGKVYTGIARNYRPDHLAVLLDAIGACSIKDGCGVITNELKDLILNRSPEEIRELSTILSEIGSKKMAKKELVDQLIQNCNCWSDNDRTVLEAMSDDKVQHLIDADIKHKNDQALLNAAKRGYEGKEGSYVFNEQTRQWEYKEKPAPAPAPTPAPQPSPNPTPTPAPGPTPSPAPTPTPSGVTKNEILNAMKGLTPAEFFEIAPPEVQEDIAESRRIKQETKNALVQRWVDNAASDKKDAAKAWAEKQTLENLRAVVDAIPVKPAVANPYLDGPDYSGRAGGVQNNEFNNLQKPEPLGRYEWDFSTP